MPTRFFALLLPYWLLGLVAADGDGDGAVERDKQALAPCRSLVGEWRGVGQPKRGSTRGAWTEQSQWSWSFAEGRAELRAEIDDGHFFGLLQLRPGDEPGEFVLLATPLVAGDTKSTVAPRRFRGEYRDGTLVVTAEQATAGQPARITIRLVAGGDRLVVLYEQATGEESFSRLAEVASTRRGSSFATAAAAGRECVVTGGLGTIAVEYDGRTYYVCCGGCREAFNDDPQGVLDDYRQRKAAQREAKENRR
ncbi:MAG: hypothetical protein AB7U73_17740 [Pirellulales bacterium]